jgi:CRP-like cAMP-binding protein
VPLKRKEEERASCGVPDSLLVVYTYTYKRLPNRVDRVHHIHRGPLSNELLASLPEGDLQLLIPHLTSVQLPQGTVIAEPGVEVDHAYFPLSGAVSLLAVMRDGKAIETGTVRREGVFGAMSGIAPCKSEVRAIAQLPMFAGKIASTKLRKAVSSSKPIADLCLCCNEGLLTQARIGAACNGLHPIEARLCRWLLHIRDRADSDTIMLTQEFLAQMLGVRRTSVTTVASKIHAAGAISYSRGVIKIIDPETLKAMSCECYEALREHTSSFGQPEAGVRSHSK